MATSLATIPGIPQYHRSTAIWSTCHRFASMSVQDEVLLDDARCYGERAFASGADATVDVWEGMPHGFASGIGRLNAANQVLDAVGAFLRAKLASA